MVVSEVEVFRLQTHHKIWIRNVITKKYKLETSVIHLIISANYSNSLYINVFSEIQTAKSGEMDTRRNSDNEIPQSHIEHAQAMVHTERQQNQIFILEQPYKP